MLLLSRLSIPDICLILKLLVLLLFDLLILNLNMIYCTIYADMTVIVTKFKGENKEFKMIIF